MGELANAVRDLRYLLDHGYPRESAVAFVANHYRFPREKRHLLARCVFSQLEVAKHKRKTVGASGARGKRLGIDGYNVLITAESILARKQVVLCDDGFIRDLRAIFGKYRMSSITPRVLGEILRLIADAKPKGVEFLFDQQVSRSGELAATVRRLLRRMRLRGHARTVVGVDAEIRGFDVVASSDRAIIERVRAAWDIPAEVAGRRKAKILDLTKL